MHLDFINWDFAKIIESAILTLFGSGATFGIFKYGGKLVNSFIELRLAMEAKNAQVDLNTQNQEQMKLEMRQQFERVFDKIDTVGKHVDQIEHDVRGVRQNQAGFLEFTKQADHKIEKIKDRVHEIELKVS